MTVDERIARGLAAQLERRRELLAGGAAPVGWKIGFNLPEVQARLGIDGPVVGFLTTDALLAAGEPCALGGAGVIAESEVAIHLGADVPPGAGRAEAAAAIAGLSPAIELTDPPIGLDDLAGVLAANVFHRAVLVGRPVPQELGGVRARTLLNGEEQGCVDALAATGDPAGVVLHVAGLLDAAGERLRAGERIIAGAMQLAMPKPGDVLELDFGPLGRLGLRFT